MAEDIQNKVAQEFLQLKRLEMQKERLYHLIFNDPIYRSIDKVETSSSNYSLATKFLDERIEREKNRIRVSFYHKKRHF